MPLSQEQLAPPWPRIDLRARVVLFTSAAVLIALILLGSALHTLLARALYEQQRKQAIQSVEALTEQAARYLEQSERPQGDPLQQLLDQLVSGRGNGAVSSYDVLVARLGESRSSVQGSFTLESLPPELVTRVLRSERAYVYVPAPPGEGRRVLLIGTPVYVAGGPYQAYFRFPLTFQETALSEMTRFLVMVALGLLTAVVLLVTISTGRVLQPIRRARDVAERIAAGDLDARLPEVSDRDDLGRLAESFNRMADALALKISELEDVSRLQARFVSDVSHELRTPLSTVRMAADYIHAARSSLPPDAQRAAVLLERELERFEQLLEDLLEISRFDAGVIALEPVEVDLEGLLEEVADTLDALAHERSVHVSLRIDREQGPPIVPADPRRLERVFTNLVKNAIEHTHEGGVRISVTREQDRVTVMVEDDGEGIPPEDLPHIFERFYRADAHRARSQGGTGLGLAIALENVNLHGGEIKVSSVVGKGSTFTVCLPAATDGSEVQDEEAAGGAAVPGPQQEVPVVG